MYIDIAADGNVSEARVDSSTMEHEPVESCLTRQFRNLKFPAKGGAKVRYPLIFSSGG